jgi:hypothetical protein
VKNVFFSDLFLFIEIKNNNSSLLAVLISVLLIMNPSIQFVALCWTLSALLFISVHEADCSSPSGTGVKNAWSCTSTPPIILHGVVLH